MKKIVVSAFSLFLLGAVSAQAQTTTGGQSTTQDQTTTQGATQGTTQSGTQAGAASGTQAETSTSTGTATQTDATSTGAAAAASTAAPGTTATGTSATGTAATADAAAAGTTVALEELPAPVKATLASEKLKTWTPSSAQLVKDATTGKEYYSIELKQANQVGTVKIGKDGKPVK
ncbi:hypothetical protein [Adhaeribacter radiodurans]|uniref:PepSY domain-containing protein n=1 Tax=Adhaeribacter radiodurans TaxID=2745197 RepID=A0A7L7LF43_9BACT|nr:hypothetical protein [Adhaeribacter radiodurans]QMU31115.1 hypothetical protein HUW48_25195 [Adhaeribacter radiodurans]